MTQEEFSIAFLGLISSNEKKNETINTKFGESIDWREKGAVTPVDS